MNQILSLLLSIVVFSACNSSTAKKEQDGYKSDNLIITQISANVYEHISYLDTKSFGRVLCNGMIVCNKNEAIIFDTPTNDETSEELISWVTEKLGCKITAVIPTHYHDDNLGGLNQFHKHNIPSYAYNPTIEIAKEKGYAVPQNGFSDLLELSVGDKKVYADFLGGGHTRDNVIGYFPSEKVMFGGCLIKELGAGKGNLEEAVPQEWSATVKAVQAKYPETKIVVPGHGKRGGTELFEYTINLFE